MANKETEGPLQKPIGGKKKIRPPVKKTTSIVENVAI